jgi:hypothetical protein
MRSCRCKCDGAWHRGRSPPLPIARRSKLPRMLARVAPARMPGCCFRQRGIGCSHWCLRTARGDGIRRLVERGGNKCDRAAVNAIVPGTGARCHRLDPAMLHNAAEWIENDSSPSNARDESGNRSSLSASGVGATWRDVVPARHGADFTAPRGHRKTVLDHALARAATAFDDTRGRYGVTTAASAGSKSR